MTTYIPTEKSHPIDVVISWVDGSDTQLAEKRNLYLTKQGDTSIPGAHPTRFASINEIRYCVLSVFRFAPFIRNIFIITDNQDPELYDDLKKHFPERLNSLRIVDHSEIFEGYEQFLPTFNSISIGNMIWRVKGLSDNFVYFNDDTFLVRPVKPEDWFVENKPVIRGKWVPAPFLRILWNGLKIVTFKLTSKHKIYQPRASFHMGQWHSAKLLGFRFRYFTNSHTPHTVARRPVEDFFNRESGVLELNISHRFRTYSQFTFISLSNHLQLLSGNRQIAKPDLAYMQPLNRNSKYVEKKIRLCEKNHSIKFVCVQSLDLSTKDQQERVLAWMEKILQV